MMGGVRAALNSAWETTDRRSFLQGKTVDVLFVWGTGFLVLIAIGMVVAVRVVTSQTDLVSDTLLVALAWLAGTVIPFLVLACACPLVYRYVPSSRPAWLDVLPGAIVAVVAIEGVWVGYSIYAVTFAEANAVYGALGVIFGLLLFVYISAIAFIFGAEYSAQWALAREQRVASTRGDSQASTAVSGVEPRGSEPPSERPANE
jgi:membrane protein